MTTLWYFSYVITEGYFVTVELSDLYYNERELMMAMVEFHNGDEVEFYMGERPEVDHLQFATARELVRHVESQDPKRLITIQVTTSYISVSSVPCSVNEKCVVFCLFFFS